ncbi:MAG: extracellular solute-binding protein [Oscillospiraceae bacterium]|nr:extracellular solute-binding protein [Oscillospiraceae bacterium]
MKKKIIFSLLCSVVLIFSSCRNDKNKSSMSATNTSSSLSDVYKVSDTGLVIDEEIFIDAYLENDSISITKAKYDNYLEIRIFDCLNEKETSYEIGQSEFCNGLGEDLSVCTDDNNIYILSKSSGSTYLYTINKKNKTVSDPVEFKDAYACSMKTDTAGKIYILYSCYGIQDKTTTIEVFQNSAQVNKIDISDVFSQNNGKTLRDMYADKQGNIYCLYSSSSGADSYGVMKLNTDGRIAADCEVRGISGDYISMLASSSGKIFVTSKSDDNNLLLVNEIDKDSCDTINFYETEAYSIVTGGTGDYDLILSDTSKFMGYKADSNITQDIEGISNNSQNIFSNGNEIISYEFGTHFKNSLITADMNSYEISAQKDLDADEETAFVSCAAFSNGCHYYVRKTGDKNILTVTDHSGAVTDKQEINNLNNEDIVSVAVDKDSDIYLLTCNYSDELYSIKKYDSHINLISEFQMKDVKSSEKILVYDDVLYVTYYSALDNKNILSQVDFDNKKLNNTEIIIDNVVDICLDSADDTLILKDSRNKIYKYNDSDKTCKEIFVLDNISMINTVATRNILVVDDSIFFLYSEYDNKLYKVKRLNKSETEDMNIVSIACDSDVHGLNQIIQQFNNAQDDVTYVLTSYNDNEKRKNFNMDISTGKVPDIIISSGQLDTSIFENKNVLVDLSEYIKTDDTLNSQDYYMNISQSCSSGNKITQLVPSFTVLTAVGSSSMLGDKTGWTYKEFLDFVDQKEGQDIFYKGVICDTISVTPDKVPFATYSDFIELKKGACNIDKDYNRLLEIYKSSRVEDDKSDEDCDKNALTDAFQARFLNGQCLIDVQKIYNVNIISKMKYAYINDDIVFKGIPSQNCNGSYVIPDFKISMLETCKCQDEAWNFIKYFISEEYQNKVVQDGTFPVKRSSFEKLYDECVEDDILINEKEYRVPVPDEKLKNQINNWIESITSSVLNDDSLSSIAQQEIQCYYDDGQTSEETIKNMMSKIKLYLSESK